MFGFPLGDREQATVLGKSYLTRQVATLLRFARSTSDPNLATILINKAADLKAKIDDAPHQKMDVGLAAPDVLSAAPAEQIQPQGNRPPAKPHG
jgi:hypothetical protein